MTKQCSSCGGTKKTGCQYLAAPQYDYHAESNKLRAKVERLTKEREAILASLIAIGTGRVTHSFVGGCPDRYGHDARDAECPACRMLMEAEKTVMSDLQNNGQAAAIREAFEIKYGRDWADPASTEIADPFAAGYKAALSKMMDSRDSADDTALRKWGASLLEDAERFRHCIEYGFPKKDYYPVTNHEGWWCPPAGNDRSQLHQFPVAAIDAAIAIAAEEAKKDAP